MCTPLFCAALLTIARTRKQPKCLSTDEWIKIGTYLPVEILLSHKRNKTRSFAWTCGYGWTWSLSYRMK